MTIHRAGCALPFFLSRLKSLLVSVPAQVPVVLLALAPIHLPYRHGHLPIPDTGGCLVRSHFPLHFLISIGSGLDSFCQASLVLWTWPLLSSSSHFSQLIRFSVLLWPSSLQTWLEEPLCLPSPPTHCWFIWLLQHLWLCGILCRCPSGSYSATSPSGAELPSESS